ncbi:YopX family protein [Enterococcus sp. LJL90]
MGEIKYRVWIPEEKQMGTVGILYLKWGNVDVVGGDSYDLKDIKLIQFTGLKDKNGAEIYEGDICKFYVRFGIEVGIIKFVRNGFNICFDGGYMYRIDEFQIEVIGNVYENPELLKVD